jgi:hypothetical protein
MERYKIVFSHYPCIRSSGKYFGSAGLPQAWIIASIKIISFEIKTAGHPYVDDLPDKQLKS